MKSTIAILIIIAACPAFTQYINNLENGDLAFSKRGYSIDGIASTRKAIKAFQEGLKISTDKLESIELLVKLSSAQYFLGSALSQKGEKEFAFLEGKGAAEIVSEKLNLEDTHNFTDTKIESVKTSLSDEEILWLVKSMYLQGTNQAQWGNIKGPAVTIGQLPEVLGNMTNIEKLGHLDLYNYGTSRTVGRIRFILPEGLGGNLEVSENLLREAVINTLALGVNKKYSVNAHNNLYYAETLYLRGKEKQAKTFLKNFIQSDPSTWDQSIVPENNEALREALNLAKTWKVEL